MRLLRRRRDKSRSNAGWAATAPGYGSRQAQSRKTQENEARDQILKMVALLERLLRTVQAAGDLCAQADDLDQGDAELLLPDLHRLQARGCRAGAAGISSGDRPAVSPSLDESLSWSAAMQLWPSVLDARLWLEAELELLFPTVRASAESGSYGPDDDLPGDVPAPIQTARLHFAAIKALHLSHSTCKMGVLEGKTLENHERAWTAFEAHLAQHRGAKKDVEMQKVSDAARNLVETLARLGTDPSVNVSVVRSAGATFWTRLDASLPESVVPVLPKPVRSSLAPSVLSKRQSLASLGAEAQNKEPASPHKRTASSPAPSPTKARRKSLEDLPPLDVDVSRAIHQPVLLRSTSSEKGRIPSTAAVDPTASGTGVHFPIDPSTSPKRLLTRTISHADKSAGGVPSPALLSAPPRFLNGRNRAVSSIGPVAPSYSHHFGSTTITGAQISSAPERPSSVVSDSPSLLFGEDNALAGPSYTSPERGQGHPSGILPRSPLAGPSGAGMQPSQSHSGELFLGPRASSSARRPSMPSRQRVTSLYGTPSLNTSHVHTSGLSSAAYGHVGPSGVFDPTASLRENQYRRRRADSNASVATGISLFSTQAMMHDEAPGLSFSPPDGHAMGTLINNGAGASARYPSDHRAGASDLLRGKLRPRLDSSVSARGRHVVSANGPAAAATAAAIGLGHGARAEAVPAAAAAAGAVPNGAGASAAASTGTPLLTERLERKLAASYASQQRVASGGGGVAADTAPASARRRDDASINSRYSTTSRRTGLASLRAPSFFPHAPKAPASASTGVAPPVLNGSGILPKSTTSTSLATSAETANATTEVAPSDLDGERSGAETGPTRTRTTSSDTRGSARSALGTLRAIRQRAGSSAAADAPASASEDATPVTEPEAQAASHSRRKQRGARAHPTLQDMFVFPSAGSASEPVATETSVAAAPARTVIASALSQQQGSRSGASPGAENSPRPALPQRRSFFGIDPTSGGYGHGASLSASPSPSVVALAPVSPSASLRSPTRSALKSPSLPSSPDLEAGAGASGGKADEATAGGKRTSPNMSVRSVRFEVPSGAPSSSPVLRQSPFLDAEEEGRSAPIGIGLGIPMDAHASASPFSPSSPSKLPGTSPSTANGGSSSSPLDPALAHAEDLSRLKTAGSCGGCGAACVNAPTDRRGRKFCSRECRVEVTRREKGQKGEEGERDKGSVRSNRTTGSRASSFAPKPAQAVAAVTVE